MYKRETQTVHLGIYGQTGAKTVRLLFEGLREHVDWKDKDPRRNGRKFTGDQVKVRVDATGEVVLDVVKESITGHWAQYSKDKLPHSAFAKGFDTAYVKGWLANELRLLSHGRQADEVFQLHPASKTSQTSRAWEAQATAAALSGEDVEDKYGKKVFDKVVGQIADPIRTEVAAVVAEEAKRIHAEFDSKRRDIHHEMLVKIAELRKAYRQRTYDLGKEERKAVTAMKKEMLAA